MMTKVRPFWARVAVAPSPLDDEDQRPSGLIVPFVVTGGPPPLRGIVVALDAAWMNDAEAEQIPPGTVVYYRGGTEIGDVVIVDPNQILAYETE